MLKSERLFSTFSIQPQQTEIMHQNNDIKIYNKK